MRRFVKRLLIEILFEEPVQMGGEISATFGRAVRRHLKEPRQRGRKECEDRGVGSKPPLMGGYLPGPC